MKPHKWAKEIIAWANGAEIEYKDGTWWDIKQPNWHNDGEYRIKPQPKELPEVVKHWLSLGVDMETIEKTVVEVINKQFPKPKEPQYLYAYFDYKKLAIN